MPVKIGPAGAGDTRKRTGGRYVGRYISIVLGLILLALGVAGIIVWAQMVVQFILAILALGLVLIGLVAVAFGLSELRSAAEERRITGEESAAPEKAEPEGGSKG